MKPSTRLAVGLLAAVTAAPMPALLAPGIAVGEPAANAAAEIVPMAPNFRRCDFSAYTFIPARGDGHAFALTRFGPSAVSAEVHLLRARPDTRYDVRLIQAPRPSSAGCAAGDAGVASNALVTDAVGIGTVTLTDTVQRGATGAWVFISIPGEFSQTPEESYTSDYIASA